MGTQRMSHRLRLTIVLLGALIILFSLVALSFALNPGIDLREQATLAPTLFSPP
jgi:hypothetical protein